MNGIIQVTNVLVWIGITTGSLIDEKDSLVCQHSVLDLSPQGHDPVSTWPLSPVCQRIFRPPLRFHQ